MDLTQIVGQPQESNGKNISKSALLARCGHSGKKQEILQDLSNRKHQYMIIKEGCRVATSESSLSWRNSRDYSQSFEGLDWSRL